MSAHDQVRAMLDELMGTARDATEDLEHFITGAEREVLPYFCGKAVLWGYYSSLNDSSSLATFFTNINCDASRCQMKFDDPRVCKSFLLSCCPHDILSSTRMDLGECPKYHDVALRADYENASKKKDYFYDIDAMEHLQTFISECDRKTEMYKRRLKETQEELSEEANSKAESIHNLGEEIGTKLARAETEGAEGKVEESMQLLNEVEDLKKKKVLAEQEYKNSMPASSYQQQKLRVCEICSAYLGIHDNDRRLADHFGGKLHLGFITIRDKLADLKSTHADRIRQRGEEREKQRQKREEERKRDEDDRRRSRSRSRRRSRSRSRSRRRRSHSRSRRSRSRSRHARKKSRRRSRSRDRKSRSRDRKRSRRSRSRSRSRRHRSSSRSRSRHRKSRRKTRSRSRSKKRSASVENGSRVSSPEHPAIEDY